MQGYSFHKEERLKSRKLISSLFREGQSVYFHPLRVLYREKETERYPAKIAISIPKKFIRHAVTRNLLKRRIREAYRLNKPAYYEAMNNKEKQYYLMVLYQSEKIFGYRYIEQQLNKSLEKLLSG